MKSISNAWPQGRMSRVQAPHEIYVEDPPAVQRAIDDVLPRAAAAYLPAHRQVR